ncbi:MAG: LCP family protein [Ruminococcus sp.]|nr:LCP family protein [Ruminococcus sp.]MDE6538864.1 LCP family protein [Ruminococcus sp.]
MAKKKSGHIAVPFLLTIFFGLLIVGGGAYGIYRYFGFGQSDPLDEPTPRAAATVTAEDNHTILLILDEPEQKCTSTFVLMRSKPLEKRVLFIGIPTNTISIIDGQQEHIKNSYDRGGAQAAVNFVNQTFGITVDRYIKFTPEAFRKVCDVLGGVTYYVEPDIAGFKKNGGEEYLNSNQIETLITYPMFNGREVQRAYMASSVLSSMINQTDGKRVADNFKASFDSIINMVSTDITAVDYKNRQYAIRNMLENGTSIANFIIIDGETSNDDFIPSETFINDMRNAYFKE